jgi:hypothetical protein
LALENKISIAQIVSSIRTNLSFRDKDSN